MLVEPKVLYEDNHLLAIWKPAGWLVQGDDTGDKTLTDWGKHYLRMKYEKPGNIYCNPVHRIDRPVSGAVLFARTDKAATRLTALFKEQKVAKMYFALTQRKPPELAGRLVHFLEKDGEKNIVKAFNLQHNAPKSAKECVLDYEWLGEFSGYNALRIKPLTGRSHQIRAQLAAIKCPIVGDVKYGASTAIEDKSIALHCFSMSFEHPIKKEPILIKAEFFPKNDVWGKVAANLRGYDEMIFEGIKTKKKHYFEVNKKADMPKKKVDPLNKKSAAVRKNRARPEDV
jgi:23S rRNA pseudouridine1911/1915/1917 synthase